MKNIPRMKHVKNQAVIQRQEGKLCVYVPPLLDQRHRMPKIVELGWKKINRLANRPAYIFLIDAQLIGVALGALSISIHKSLSCWFFCYHTHRQDGRIDNQEPIYYTQQQQPIKSYFEEEKRTLLNLENNDLEKHSPVSQKFVLQSTYMGNGMDIMNASQIE